MRLLIAFAVAVLIAGCGSSDGPKSTTTPLTNDGSMKVNPPESGTSEEKTDAPNQGSTTASQAIEGIWLAQATDESGSHTFELHLESGGSAVLHIATVNPDKEPASHAGTWTRAQAAITVALEAPSDGQGRFETWLLRAEGSSLASQSQPSQFGATKLVFTRSAG